MVLRKKNKKINQVPFRREIIDVSFCFTFDKEGRVVSGGLWKPGKNSGGCDLKV